MKTLYRIAVLIGLLITVGWQADRKETEGGTGVKNQVAGTKPRALSALDYSYAYWLNGWRKQSANDVADVLCFETGRYGFLLDLADVSNPRFGRLRDGADYGEALVAGTRRIDSLQSAQLTVALELDGKTYRAVSCPRQGARMWESGRVAQHFDLLDLRFEDDNRNPLPCYGTLNIVAWPGSLTFTVEMTPDRIYVDGPCQGLVGNALCIVDEPLDIPHSAALEPEHLTAECWVNIPRKMGTNVYGWLLCKNGHEWGQGNYGLMLRRGALIAVLNNVGGKNAQHMIKQQGKLKPGKWHHLALTYDGQTMRLYVDGREHGAKPLTEARKPGKGVLRIGKRADGNFAVVRALYDQVRIWGRALTREEIRAHVREPGKLPNRD